MMKKIIVFVCVLLTISVLFSSCDSSKIIRPVESLLAPPLYHEEYEELVEVFRENVGKDIVFCSPQEGDYRSAIVVEDVDCDGEDEALIFYRENAGSSVARMHYLNIVNGEWVSRKTYNGYGNEIKKVIISDMDNDSNSELIVVWNVSGVSTSNIMSVYRTSYSFDEYKEISNEMCTVCEVVDVDGDSTKEIFYLNQVNVSGVAQRYARITKISGETVVLMGETKVDPNISSYTSVKTEKSSGDEPFKFYIDALKGDSQMITELVYWDEKNAELCSPFLDSETMANTATLRYQPIASADINNDGTIDIPTQTRTLGKASAENNIYVTDWINYSANKTRVVETSVVNFADGYMIHLDESDIKTTGIRDYSTQNCWIVFKTNSSGKSLGELYSVLKISAERWNKEEFNKYVPVIEKDDGVVCVYITQSGSEAGIDTDYIKSRISKIS